MSRPGGRRRLRRAENAASAAGQAINPASPRRSKRCAATDKRRPAGQDHLPQQFVVGLGGLACRPEPSHRARTRSMVRRCNDTPNSAAIRAASSAPDTRRFGFGDERLDLRRHLQRAAPASALVDQARHPPLVERGRDQIERRPRIPVGAPPTSHSPRRPHAHGASRTSPAPCPRPRRTDRHPRKSGAVTASGFGCTNPAASSACFRLASRHEPHTNGLVNYMSSIHCRSSSDQPAICSRPASRSPYLWEDSRRATRLALFIPRYCGNHS